MPKKVFIVDDADFVVKMLSLIMNDAGYQVTGTASDGEQAVAFLKALPPADLPDIITLDFHMPKMDGMEALRHIRAMLPRARIVLISSDATLGVVKMAKDAGIDAFIAKPFEDHTVLETLAKLE